MNVCCIRTQDLGVLMASTNGHSFAALLGSDDKPLRTFAELVRATNGSDLVHEGPRYSFEVVEVLPPVASPEKIFGIGLNYSDHAAETGASVGEIPVVFNKLSTSISASGRPIVLPPVSQQVDFEAELVVVIGRTGRHIHTADARRHIFGVCCGNDVSARDWQKGKPGGQWLLGKSFDTFAPIGPWITTLDSLAWPLELDIRLKLNGEEMQASNTRNLIFSIEYLVAHLSKFCTLNPGDLIFTGTPSGVGVARNPPVFLSPGDCVEVCIATLGEIRNPVIAG